MKLKFFEHLLSTIAVTILLLGMLVVTRNQAAKGTEVPKTIKPYVEWEFMDLNDPFEKALFSDLLENYYPGRKIKNKRTVSELAHYKQDEILSSLQGSHFKEGLTGKKFILLIWMYIKFLLVYVIVMALTYYGVQTLAVRRFVLDKRKTQSAAAKGLSYLFLTILKKMGSAVGTFILFTPAYIIAYSIRTEFNTDILVFVVLLAAISNGLLAMYSTKFHTFLKAESRKGYVDTAVVKNLKNNYGSDAKQGIPRRAIYRFRKRFDNHVFGHIFKNAEFQYLATLKEQAAFLITGLIIIEMALNIHGHLSYEMLKQLLYKNYDIVITILLLIFLTVKATEFFTDLLITIRNKKVENRTAGNKRSRS